MASVVAVTPEATGSAAPAPPAAAVAPGAGPVTSKVVTPSTGWPSTLTTRATTCQPPCSARARTSGADRSTLTSGPSTVADVGTVVPSGVMTAVVTNCSAMSSE